MEDLMVKLRRKKRRKKIHSKEMAHRWHCQSRERQRCFKRPDYSKGDSSHKFNWSRVRNKIFISCDCHLLTIFEPTKPSIVVSQHPQKHQPINNYFWGSSYNQVFDLVQPDYPTYHYPTYLHPLSLYYF